MHQIPLSQGILGHSGAGQRNCAYCCSRLFCVKLFEQSIAFDLVTSRSQFCINTTVFPYLALQDSDDTLYNFNCGWISYRMRRNANSNSFQFPNDGYSSTYGLNSTFMWQSDNIIQQISLRLHRQLLLVSNCNITLSFVSKLSNNFGKTKIIKLALQ